LILPSCGSCGASSLGACSPVASPGVSFAMIGGVVMPAFDVVAARLGIEKQRNVYRAGREVDVMRLVGLALEALDALALVAGKLREMEQWAESFAATASSNIARANAAESECVSLRQRLGESEATRAKLMGTQARTAISREKETGRAEDANIECERLRAALTVERGARGRLQEALRSLLNVGCPGDRIRICECATCTKARAALGDGGDGR
jgi:hypothetical protein